MNDSGGCGAINLVYCEAGFDVGRIDVGLFAMDRT